MFVVLSEMSSQLLDGLPKIRYRRSCCPQYELNNNFGDPLTFHPVPWPSTLKSLLTLLNNFEMIQKVLLKGLSQSLTLKKKVVCFMLGATEVLVDNGLASRCV